MIGDALRRHPDRGRAGPVSSSADRFFGAQLPIGHSANGNRSSDDDRLDGCPVRDRRLSGESKATETAIDKIAANDETRAARPAATGDNLRWIGCFSRSTTRRIASAASAGSPAAGCASRAPSSTNGTHTDGRLTVTISGLGDTAAGAPDTFDWEADRPIALVIVRAGVDGDDVSFHVGPASAGSGIGTLVGDGTGIRYIAFCYDAEPDPVAVSVPPTGRQRSPSRPCRGSPGRRDRLRPPLTPTLPASIAPDPRPPRPTAPEPASGPGLRDSSAASGPTPGQRPDRATIRCGPLER